MVVFWSVLVFADRPAVNVPENKLSNSWCFPTRRMDMSVLRWNLKRSLISPEICAELLSVDAWRLVDCGRFVRDEDKLPLETRSALRAVQSASVVFTESHTLPTVLWIFRLEPS